MRRPCGKAKKVGNLVKFGYNPAPAQERAQNKDSNNLFPDLTEAAKRELIRRLIQVFL